MDILLLVSLAIIFGLIAGKIVGLLRLPGVVGYLLAGLMFGPSFLNVFNSELLEQLSGFTSLALSIVAFMIGCEMKLGNLKDMGKGIAAVILSESFGAFLLVAGGVYLLTGKLYLALIFGAMAPASAPAGTVAVLQESKAKGRLTNAIYAVVGLDDGLAIIIFAFAIAVAKFFFTGSAISLAGVCRGPVIELIGSIALGAVLGAVTGFAAQRLKTEQAILVVCLGGILLCAGGANYLHLSLILANLSLGMVFINLFSASGRKAYRAVEYISLPIYIIFFFLAGAHLQIRLLPSMGVLGLVYIVCRIAGLMGGAFLGATFSGQDSIIRKYIGFGILSQAGVAIGLAVLAAGEFGNLGQSGKAVAVQVVNIIAATTIFFEIIGPIGTRFAVARAGEIGVNITEDDLIEAYSVADVMDTKSPVITADMPLNKVLRIVSTTGNFYYPVVDKDKELAGVVTLDGIRNTFATQELNDWLVALDIAESIVAVVTPDMALSEALERTRRLGVEYLPVVASDKDSTFVGVFDCRLVRRSLSAEVLSRQQKADSIHKASAAEAIAE